MVEFLVLLNVSKYFIRDFRANLENFYINVRENSQVPVQNESFINKSDPCKPGINIFAHSFQMDIHI